MKKTQQKRLRLIATLMVICELTLLLFLFLWLQSQYGRERRILVDELERIYDQAYMEVLDSTITFQIKNTTIRNQLEFTSSEKEKAKNLSLSDFLNNKILPNLHSDVLAKWEHEQLINFFVNSVNPIKGLNTFSIQIGPVSTDKISFKADKKPVRIAFLNKLKKQNIPLKFSWQEIPNSLIINLQDSNKTGYATNFNLYLFKNLIPVIAFSVFLALLCGLAFYLSYITVKNQYRANAEKDNFISNMSHELKTPVAVSKVAIEALQKYDVIKNPSMAQEYLAMASWEIDRLESLVENILNGLQLENHCIVLYPQPLQIVPIIQKIINHVQPFLSSKQKEIIFNDKSLNDMVSTDSLHIEGAIYNLIDNAIKYGSNRIYIEVFNFQNQLQVSIKDNGPGIPEVYQKKIFERFFRIQTPDGHQVKGHGLGLYYVHHVIQSLGGNITLNTQQKEGTCFVFSLPLAKNEN